MRGLTLLLLFLAFAPGAFADGESCALNPKVFGGDLTPWPWGFETPFPWTRIQGIWAPSKASGCNTYFVFKTGSRSDDGSRFIRITEYDPSTCKKVSSGIGVESVKVIYAQMANGRNVFNLAVRAFDPSVLTKPTYGDAFTAEKPVIVLSMYPKSSWTLGTNYQLQKLQSATTLLCNDDD